jgi:hypothetical protein
VKICLIFDEAHRKKFYLHTCLLEGAIIVSAVIFDCFNKENVRMGILRLRKWASYLSWRGCTGWLWFMSSRKPFAQTLSCTTRFLTCWCSSCRRCKPKADTASTSRSTSSTTSTASSSSPSPSSPSPHSPRSPPTASKC